MRRNLQPPDASAALKRFALIGVGGYGAKHLKLLECFAAAGLLKLACVSDPALPALETVRTRLAAKQVPWYTDYREMLKREPGLDAVVISTPIPLHLEITETAIGYGLYVLLEKPPIPLYSSLERLIALPGSEKVVVAFQGIHAATTQALKQWIVSGRLGRLKWITASGIGPRTSAYFQRASWAGKLVTDDGRAIFDGPATNAMSHLIHCMNYLGAGPVPSFAEAVEVEAELYRARPIATYDTAALRGRYASGVRFLAMFSHSGEPLESCLEVEGTQGRATLCRGSIYLNGECELSTIDGADQTTQMNAFVAFVNGEATPPFSSLVQARPYVAITNAMLAASGGITSLPSSSWKCSGEGNEMVYEIRSLRDLVLRGIAERKLFSELGVEWGKKGTTIAMESPPDAPLAPEHQMVFDNGTPRAFDSW